MIKNYNEIRKEIKNAENKLKNYKNNIVIFGSARILKGSKEYNKIVSLGKTLSDNGWNVITGGADTGLMRAANLGAKQGKSKSIGFNIVLPQEQQGNKFCDLMLTFNHFSSRNFSFMNNGVAYIIASGGVGTLFEFFELATLIQTGKIKKKPIVLFDCKHIYNFMEILTNKKLISKEDLKEFYATSSVKEAINYLKKELCVQ